MERIQSINSDRVLWCCQDRGVAPDELADAVAISHAAINNVLSGSDGLTFAQLQRVAAYFNRGVLFFIEPGPVPEETVRTPQFRTVANVTKSIDPKVRDIIERAEKQRSIYLGLREDLGEPNDTDIDFRSPIDKWKQDPKIVASDVRTWLGLDRQHSFEDYRKAIESKGILVFRTNGYNGQWQIPKESHVIGFSLYYESTPVIVIRKQPVETRQVFTLFHELAHILLHKDSFIDSDDDLVSRRHFEAEANLFAGLVLVPDEHLRLINDAQKPKDVTQFEDWLRQYHKQWGVSYEVILRRLRYEQRLSESEYLAYREWSKARMHPDSSGGNRMFRHREPKHIFGEPYVRTVLEALNANQITLSRASTYLDNLKIKDIHELEHHLAGF